MFVNAHAIARITDRANGHGAGIIAALEGVAGELGDIAIEVFRWREPIADGTGSNGDQLVVIARDGEVITVMLRRSSQPFTPLALGVDRCRRLT